MECNGASVNTSIQLADFWGLHKRVEAISFSPVHSTRLPASNDLRSMGRRNSLNRDDKKLFLANETLSSFRVECFEAFEKTFLSTAQQSKFDAHRRMHRIIVNRRWMGVPLLPSWFIWNANLDHATVFSGMKRERGSKWRDWRKWNSTANIWKFTILLSEKLITSMLLHRATTVLDGGKMARRKVNRRRKFRNWVINDGWWRSDFPIHELLMHLKQGKVHEWNEFKWKFGLFTSSTSRQSF